MNLTWLNKKNNKKLIIFFNGWGMDNSVIKHLNPTSFDVLSICDYNELCELPDLSEYSEKFVIAWSMGVMVATLYNIGQKSSTAINGTLHPIHIDYGINPKVYKLMELGFNELSAPKFISKMFSGTIPELQLTRTPESQKSELTALKNYKANIDYKYNRVIVSDNDNIIPTQSQINFWGNPEIIKNGHCPFFDYTNWEELL